MSFSVIPNDSIVFVFGSNLAGRHGKGAALYARKHWGAIYGVGEGFQGNSYAIPTKDENLNTLPLEQIKLHIESFLEAAKYAVDKSFLVTAIGCGLAGYSPEQIFPMFENAPENVFISMRLIPDVSA